MKLPNGYGSITKLSGKRRRPWIVRVTDGFTETGGKVKQERKILGYYETRSKALTALAEYNQKPYDLDMTCKTFSEIYELWSAKKFKHVTPSSVRCYKAAYKYCKPIYNTVFRNLRVHGLQELLDNSGAGYASQRKLLSLFNQLFKFAVANDITDKNYAEYLKNNAVKPESRRMPFTEDEIEILKKAAPNEPYADTILIMIYTGWRIGELLTIRREDVDLEEMTMRGGMKTEAGKNRLVPIHTCIQPYVRRFYDMGKNTLIPSISYTMYRKYFDAVCEKYGMKHNPHECRHTFATRADNYGMNKVCIQRLMGHSSTNITDKVYTHKDVAELRKAIDLLP